MNPYEQVFEMKKNIQYKRNFQKQYWANVCERNTLLCDEIGKLEDELREFEAENYLLGGEDL